MSAARAEFLAALEKFAPKSHRIDVLELDVFLRPLSTSGMRAYHAAQKEGQDEQAAMLMLVDCVVDEEGKPIFTTADTGLINALPAAVSNALFEKMIDVNGLNPKAQAAALGN